jgi:hypothetical protein
MGLRFLAQQKKKTKENNVDCARNMVSTSLRVFIKSERFNLDSGEDEIFFLHSGSLSTCQNGWTVPCAADETVYPRPRTGNANGFITEREPASALQPIRPCGPRGSWRRVAGSVNWPRPAVKETKGNVATARRQQETSAVGAGVAVWVRA